LELQIAIGFALASHGIARWTQTLRLTVPISFGYCVLLAVVAYSHARQWSASARLAVWIVHIWIAVVATVLSYLCAFWGVRKAPSFARRRITQRGATYALSSLLVLPWLAYQTWCLSRIDAINFDDIQALPAYFALSLFDLSGVANVLTYVYWMTRTMSAESRASTAENAHDMESIVFHDYFTLRVNDSVVLEVNRSLAADIERLQEARQEAKH